MKINIPEIGLPRIVIVGCGFGGLALADGIDSSKFQIVLIDKNNFHTFQPLLYQVATAGLEADSIAYPIRKIFAGKANFFYRWGEVIKINTTQKQLETSLGICNYDYLVIATGTTTNFFNIEGLQEKSMPMKTVVEALNLRSLILQNFEKALLLPEEKARQTYMTFAIVGGGPTGVELAGALCELKKHVLPADYQELDFNQMRVLLIESGAEVLQAMTKENQTKALNYLKELGAEVMLNTRVVKYDGETIFTLDNQEIKSANLIWAAGVKGNLPEGIAADIVTPTKRIIVNEYCQIKGLSDVFAIGDVAFVMTGDTPKGHPQVAPVAIQQGTLLAKNIAALYNSKQLQPFVYNDKGTMATIGRNKAVVQTKNGKIEFGGFLGWAAWMFVHLMAIVGYRNRIVVLLNWVWNYINYDRNIRLIIRPYKTKNQ